jgi:hypothetical protein
MFAEDNRSSHKSSNLPASKLALQAGTQKSTKKIFRAILCLKKTLCLRASAAKKIFRAILCFCAFVARKVKVRTARRVERS